MHNLYFACQTCHVRPQEKGDTLYYYWCDRKTGDMVVNPEIGDKPIDSLGIRLTPCVTCRREPDEDSIDQERSIADELMAKIQEEGIVRAEKKKIVRQIHEPVSEQPLACNECHTKETPFLPLSQVGYSARRIAQVASDKITKMINEYEEFYTPVFLEPGRGINNAQE
jgi:hypothetical protein